MIDFDPTVDPDSAADAAERRTDELRLTFGGLVGPLVPKTTFEDLFDLNRDFGVVPDRAMDILDEIEASEAVFDPETDLEADSDPE